MRILRHSLVLALALVASMVLVKGQSAPSGTQPGKPDSVQPEAWQLLVLANEARAQAGARPLQWDSALAAAARQHCLRMVAEGQISHRYGGEPDLVARTSQAGAHFSLIEENLAVGPSPAGIQDEWMHSETHRTNLLNPQVDRLGVAVVASRGVLYAVADYAQGVAVRTPAQVEATVTALVRASGVAIVADASAARVYCAQNRVPPSAPQPSFLMRWQNSDLSHLPQPLTDRLASGRFHQAAIGSCPAEEAEGQFTAYRVAVLLY